MKPVSSIKHKLACAYSEESTQSAHPQSLISLSFPPQETLDPWLPIEHLSKTLIRLHGCAVWSESRWLHMPTWTLCWIPAHLDCNMRKPIYCSEPNLVANRETDFSHWGSNDIAVSTGHTFIIEDHTQHYTNICKKINTLHAGLLLWLFCCVQIFFNVTLFISNILSGNNISVKQHGSGQAQRSVQTVCKDHQQKTKLAASRQRV